MKILVCVSKTPETTANINFTNNNTEFDTNGVSFIMNPYDEWYALVRALELTEANGGSVTIVNVGPAANDAVIKKGLAIGAKDAVRIDAEPTSALFVAKQIAAYAKSESYDIIFTGKESIDYNGSLVGGMIAELLNLPYVSYASSLELAANTATLNREIEGGTEVVQLDTPFVVSAAKGMAEQRIPNMRGIMMAKKKPLKVVTAAAAQDNEKVVEFKVVPKDRAIKMVNPEDMAELVRLLHEEAKAI
jgi:electron transfer flavoprotein beta subunit